ncbi:MAG: nucleotidyltransferase family protein [Dehalococcoidales bacterium]|nr:nucleotidyltransferase family protein [Dehalococcoidales bacterium]
MLQSDILPGEIQKKSVKSRKHRASPRQAAREMLLLCSTSGISPAGKERISRVLARTMDWKYFITLAELHGVTPFIAHNLITNGLASCVPETYIGRLKKAYNNNLCRNIVLSSELAKVLLALNQRSIPHIVLKGTVLAEQLYGNPGLRTVSDMDILVPPGKVSEAGSVLTEIGYRQPGSGKTREHPFHESPYCKMARFPLVIELHRDLDDQNLVHTPLPMIWRRAQPLQTQGVSTKVLSPEDTLLFLSNHLSKHASGLLKSLNDIAELLKKHADTLDWNYIAWSAKSWEIETPVYYALKRANELLGAPVQMPVISGLEPKNPRRWLVNFLVNRDFFVSSTGSAKLLDETYTVARSLMMKRSDQSKLVLSRNRGSDKKAPWIRTVSWVLFVYGAAGIRNVAGAAYGEDDLLLWL